MSVDVGAIRAEFPIFAAQPAPFHYLDSAATGQICRAAADALWRFETTARSNVKRGVYRLADAATVAFHHAREQVAAVGGTPGHGTRVTSSPRAPAFLIAGVAVEHPVLRRPVPLGGQ